MKEPQSNEQTSPGVLMTPPPPTTIAACPNPECDPADYTDEDDFGVFETTWPITGGKEWHVECDCGYQGPRADTADEAIRLHNLLCRPTPQPTREAALWNPSYADIEALTAFVLSIDEHSSAIRNNMPFAVIEVKRDRVFIAASIAYPAIKRALAAAPKPTEATAEACKCGKMPSHIYEDKYGDWRIHCSGCRNGTIGGTREACIRRWNSGQYNNSRAAPKPPAEWMEVLTRLRATFKQYADNTYCTGLRIGQTTPCLGWEAKVKAGQYGETEHHAHYEHAHWDGKHRGTWECIRWLDEAIDELGEHYSAPAEGWQWVPVETTGEMQRAGFCWVKNATALDKAWAAMLAAAPKVGK